MKSSRDGSDGERQVLDFLYYDRARVGSLLSQFLPGAGLLSGVKESSGRQEGESRETGGYEATGEAGRYTAPMGFTGSASTSRAFENQYDPLWANAVSFMQAVSDHGMLHDGVRIAGVGQLVSVSGELSVQDLEITRRILSNNKVFAWLSGGKPTKASRDKEIGLGFLSELPQTTAAQMTSRDGEIWMSLNPSALTMTTAEIMLKHGINLAGQWSVVGMLDARAGEGDPVGRLPEGSAELIGDQGIRGFAHLFAPMARAFFGRPFDSYGVTPLLIYREVTRIATRS